MIYKRTQTTKQNQKNHTWKLEYQQRETIKTNQTEILVLKNTITGLKNSLDFNRRLDQEEERFSYLKDSHLKLFAQRNKNKNKKMKKVQGIYGPPWNRSTYVLWELWMKKIETKEQRAYLKKQCPKTSQNWGQRWTSKFKKLK